MNIYKRPDSHKHHSHNGKVIIFDFEKVKLGLKLQSEDNTYAYPLCDLYKENGVFVFKNEVRPSVKPTKPEEEHLREICAYIRVETFKKQKRLNFELKPYDHFHYFEYLHGISILHLLTTFYLFDNGVCVKVRLDEFEGFRAVFFIEK